MDRVNNFIDYFKISTESTGEHVNGEQELMGVAEASEHMGLDPATFSHLRKRESANENSTFPLPVAVLRCGPIWRTKEMKRFASKYVAPPRGRRPKVNDETA